MTLSIEMSEFSQPLAEYLRQEPAPDQGVELFWLGQAGFILRSADCTLVIDPYLSDSLAEKYRGKPFAHQRMMPAPITAQELDDVQFVLVTHHHTDHLDGATLRPLLQRLPASQLIVPRATLPLASERVQPGAGQLSGINAGERVALTKNVTVQAVRASHETLEQDAEGNYRFLGYVIHIGGVTLFHSGDTIPFTGQIAELAGLNIDIALLPVNGRTKALQEQGVPGNLTLPEALDLCQHCHIRYMIAHHYGLFNFNTADPALIDATAQFAKHPLLTRARLQTRFYFAC